MSAGLDQAAGIVKGILRGMRRRGLPGNVDQDDLQQAGMVAVFLSGVKGPDSLVAKVARNAMVDYLRSKFRENNTFTAFSGIEHAVDPARKRMRTGSFFFLSVDALETLWDEFRNLTAHQRRVVFHMYWGGYTEAETAETMGISESTVRRALVNASKHLKNNLQNVTGFGASQTLEHMKEENGTGKRGKGLVSTHAPSAKAPPSLERPAISQNPPPDVYYGSPDPGPDDHGNPQPGNREVFLESLNQVCASAFLQLMDVGGYNESAKQNRERVAVAVKRKVS